MTQLSQLFSKKASLWFRGLAIILVILSHYAEWWEWFTPSEGNAEIWRQAFSRLGPYGVAIFFLFSGYGLACSIGDKPMHFMFILKRLLSVYLPYLILVGIMEAMTGGFTDLEDFWDYLNGHDYWYMVVQFLFYIGFICIWAIPLWRPAGCTPADTANPAAFTDTPDFANKSHLSYSLWRRHVRAVLFVLFTWAISWNFYQNGEHSFWYISNPAFAIGVLLALYEPFFIKILNASRSPMLVLSTTGMAVVVYFGLFSSTPALWTPDETIRYELLAVQVWTILVICLASDLHRFDPLLPILGKYSLFLYLTHQFIFMRVINTMTDSFSTRFLVAALVTLTVSLTAGTVITALTGMLIRCLKKKETNFTTP